MRRLISVAVASAALAMATAALADVSCPAPSTDQCQRYIAADATAPTPQTIPLFAYLFDTAPGPGQLSFADQFKLYVILIQATKQLFGDLNAMCQEFQAPITYSQKPFGSYPGVVIDLPNLQVLYP